ncbi:MAG TPA: hypothetical protein PLQ97_00380 [Myxococcota bacterium]|nr:hypothetical protein [Myxococcota bacterium]HQK49630.1 hypothetical protein [Myxococcota bacterium]
MGFLQRTVSFFTWEVLDGPLPDHRQDLLDSLVRGRIGPIDVDLGRDQAAGFARFEDPLDTEFTEATVFFDPLVAFSFRMDRLSVPPSTYRLHLRRRIAETLASGQKSRLRKEEREELAERVRMELLRRCLPAITAHEVVWDVPKRRIRLFTTAARVREEFADRARKDLGLTMRPLHLQGVLEGGLTPEEYERVLSLLPSRFGGALWFEPASEEESR